MVGSFPGQLVVLTYYLGGGTGAAEYEWVLLDVEGSKPALQEMGLWKAVSSSRESYEFFLYPGLTLPAGKDGPGQFRFGFVYVARRQNGTSALNGDLALFQAKGPKAEWMLRPVTADDAISCLALLDCPTEAVSHWAADVLSVLARDQVQAYVKGKGQSSSGKEERRALEDAIARFYRQGE